MMEHTFIDLLDEIRRTNVDWISSELARAAMQRAAPRHVDRWTTRLHLNHDMK